MCDIVIFNHIYGIFVQDGLNVDYDIYEQISQHYNDGIMGAIASQITSLTIVYSIVYSDAYQRKDQSSASLAFVWGIRRGPVNSPHTRPVTRKMSPFDDVIMDISQMPCKTAILFGNRTSFWVNIGWDNVFILSDDKPIPTESAFT